MGLRLINRTTRRLQLTMAGEELYRHARAVVTAVEAAVEAVRRNDGRPRGLLRISVPPLHSEDFMGMLLDFAERYPGVELELLVSSRHEDLIARNIDLAWRAGTELDPGLVARTVYRTEMIGVASPAYLDRAGVPSSPDDLREHSCLLGFARGERPATHWPLREGPPIRVRGRLVANDVVLLLDAARRGMGIGLLPTVILGDALASGELVQVLPGVLGTELVVALVYPHRRLMRPAVRAFVDYVTERLRERHIDATVPRGEGEVVTPPEEPAPE